MNIYEYQAQDILRDFGGQGGAGTLYVVGLGSGSTPITITLDNSANTSNPRGNNSAMGGDANGNGGSNTNSQTNNNNQAQTADPTRTAGLTASPTLSAAGGAGGFGGASTLYVVGLGSGSGSMPSITIDNSAGASVGDITANAANGGVASTNNTTDTAPGGAGGMGGNGFGGTSTASASPTISISPSFTFQGGGSTPSSIIDNSSSATGTGGSNGNQTQTNEQSFAPANTNNNTSQGGAGGTAYAVGLGSGGNATAAGNGGNAANINSSIAPGTASGGNATANATGTGSGVGKSTSSGSSAFNNNNANSNFNNNRNVNNNANYGFVAVPEGSIVGTTGTGGYFVGHAGGVVATDAAGNYGHGYGHGYQGAPRGYSGRIENGGQCHFVDATVIKSIHAICVSADGHQFPASHMTPETWINSGYEGEVARCLPGSTLRVLVGSVMQSNQGMATSYKDAEGLVCGSGEAVRHYKDGMLKCAPAEKVVDCTERANLRNYGTGDMFFTYVTKVCLEQHYDLIGGQTRESAEEAASRAQSYARSQAQARELYVSGMTLGVGVGDLGSYRVDLPPRE